MNGPTLGSVEAMQSPISDIVKALDRSCDWRIVTNGRRYRVQKKVGRKGNANPCQVNNVWEDVAILLGLTADPWWQRVAFETRFLWRAKWRMAREIQMHQQQERDKQWEVVND